MDLIISDEIDPADVLMKISLDEVKLFKGPNINILYANPYNRIL